MPNPDPVKTEEFYAQQYKAADVPEAVELEKAPLCVNVPKAHGAYVRSQPSKTAWMRAAVAEKIEREQGQGSQQGLNPDQLQEHINAVLLSIRPRERAEAAKLFKKLVESVKKEYH